MALLTHRDATAIGEVVGGRFAFDATHTYRCYLYVFTGVRRAPTTDYRPPTTMTIIGLGVSEEAGTRAPAQP